MKKILFILLLSGFTFIRPFNMVAQGPPPPPGANGNGNAGSGDVNGQNAPLGGGLFILLSLGAAYGGKKLYRLFDETKKDLES